MDWIDLAQGRNKWRYLVNTARDKISGFTKCGEFLDLLGNYQRVDNSEPLCLLLGYMPLICVGFLTQLILYPF